jgi:hypothetical protein
MSGHPIFIRIDRDCMHRKFVGRAEDTDGNFLETDEMECYVSGLKRRVHSYRIAPHGLRQGSLSGARHGPPPCGAWFEWSAQACLAHWGWRQRWVRAWGDEGY